VSLQLVGAGLGRTGTHSLKEALARLLGGPCYHMTEVFGHLDHVPEWRRAIAGEPVDWDALFDGYVATVDWPGAACWRQLADAYPDAVVLLSVRSDAAAWFDSFDRTIADVMRRPTPPGMDDWFAMSWDMLGHHGIAEVDDRDAVVAAYERHNAEVRASVPADRLVEWQPADGWAPLCTALGVPVPDEPFPVTNSTDEFRVMAGLD